MNLFIKIFRKLFNRENSILRYYIANGNLMVDQSSDISKMNVYIQNPIPNFVYINIGKQCSLAGQYLIYDNQSKIEIGDRVFIGEESKIFCREQIILGNDIMISWGCTLIDTDAHSLHSLERKNDVTDWMRGPEHKNWDCVISKPIEIKDKCWIGFNSIITKGVTLSEGCVLGAGSVLTKTTEPYGVYAGNPAVYIKKTD